VLKHLRAARRRLKLLVATGAIVVALSFTAVALAAEVAWFYPPAGWSTSHGYPSGTGSCGFAWSHSIVTHSYKDTTQPDTFIEYYDTYGGSNSNLWWRNTWIADGSDSSRSMFFAAPGAWSFAYDFTVWPNRWFNHTAYGETRFGIPNAPSCQGVSWGVFGP
jgi:hypothetical protein